MADTARVVSLGSILIDLTVDVPTLPERGGDVLATATRTRVGGGFNLAAAVARQGIRCVYGAPWGSGPYGDLVRRDLEAEGIELGGAARVDGDTGFCINLVEPDGERTFITMAGVEGRMTRGGLDALRPTTTDLVSVSGYDLLYEHSGPVLAEWLSTVQVAELVLDPGPLVGDIPIERWRAVASGLTVLTLNQREARMIAETSTATGFDLLDAVRPRVAQGALVIVREGASGCVAAGGTLGDRIIHVAAPAVIAVDTTGAGDTHTGVLLAELARGTGIDDALELATRAAAISVTRLGSATAPARAELLR
jgi:ribokinase